jgi:hypothetical protein
MVAIAHKVFVSAAIDLRILKPNIEIYDEIRVMAQNFINTEVGAENVVAITESIESGRLTVVVWHKAVAA